MIDYKYYEMSSEEKIKYIFSAAAVLWGVGFVFFENIYLASLLALGSFFYPKYKSRDLLNKRKTELNVQFKEALYSLATSLSVGKSLENSFKAALNDLKILYPMGDAYIITEITHICRRLELNEPLERALQDFADRSGLEDIKNFADVILICKRSGGNLVQVVKNTAHIIGDKIEIRQEIELLLTRQKYEQKLLNIMPLVFLSLIKFGGSGYMDPLYTSVKGYLLMAAALVILAASFLISKKIVDIRV